MKINFKLSRVRQNLCWLACVVFGLLCSASTAHATHPSTRNDYDGDGKADIAVYRPGALAFPTYYPSYWYILRSTDGALETIPWGQSYDTPVPGDFDADGTTDPVVMRYIIQGNGSEYTAYFIKYSTGRMPDATIFSIPYGYKLARDYDGDKYADISELRTVNLGTAQNPALYWSFFVQVGSESFRSEITGPYREHYHQYPAAGDYDGDSISDIGVYDDYDSTFYIWPSSPMRPRIVHLNINIHAPGDFDGDGKTDCAGLRVDTVTGSATWVIARSRYGDVIEVPNLALKEDIPVPADYDGDGTDDLAVFRPSNSTWYIKYSSDGSLHTTVFGLSSDIPLAAPYIQNQIFPVP